MNDEFESRYGDTMRRVKSNHSVPTTLERVAAAIRNRGLKFFGCHGPRGRCREYGLGVPKGRVGGFQQLSEGCM